MREQGAVREQPLLQPDGVLHRRSVRKRRLGDHRCPFDTQRLLPTPLRCFLHQDAVIVLTLGSQDIELFQGDTERIELRVAARAGLYIDVPC